MTTNNSDNITLPVSITSGGTGSITAAAAMTALSPLTTAGDIIAFDGSNNVRFTKSATASNILEADSSQATGLNWLTGGPIFRSTTVLTSAQVKALNSSPITLVPAPGAGVLNCLVMIVCKYTYGGSNAFATPQTLNIKYVNSSGNLLTPAVSSTGFIDQTSSRYLVFVPVSSIYTTCEASVITVSAGGAITGNAANDNTLTFVVYYTQVTI